MAGTAAHQRINQMDGERYTIDGLAEQAGVAPRTIRYYTAEGILPPPTTRGRYAVYTEEHLQRLRLITQLKQGHLPLSEIRSRLAQLTTAEIEQLLRDYQPPPLNSASEYLADILERATAPPSPRLRLRERRAAAPRLDTGSLDVRNTTSYSKLEEATLHRPIPPISEQHASLTQPSFANQRGKTLEASTGETWQRIVLTTGVEIHVRAEIALQLQELVNQLLLQAQELFRDSKPQ